jgi:hypothetical protein
MCRKHHGSSFATFASTALGGFRFLAGQSAIASYASSPSGQRSFCTGCGSVTPLLLEAAGVALCPAGNLDGDLGLTPQGHMFASSRAPWTSLEDGLPRWDAYPPGIDGPSFERPRVEPKPGTLQGSCLCGDVAFEYHGAPARMLHCHCSRCRRSRGAPHATNLGGPMENFRWVRGLAQVTLYKLPEAQIFSAAFCQRCGSQVPWMNPARGTAVMPAGSLDDDPGLRPTGHIHLTSKAGWFTLPDDGLTRFDDSPLPPLPPQPPAPQL